MIIFSYLFFLLCCVGNWIIHTEKNVGITFEHVEAEISLIAGRRYRSTVTLCHSQVCFQPISSNGFIVLSQPPETGSLSVLVSDEETVSNTAIELTFQPFVHTYVEDGALTPDDLMDYYDWLIMDEAGSDGGIFPWKKIESGDITIDNDHVS